MLLKPLVSPQIHGHAEIGLELLSLNPTMGPRGCSAILTSQRTSMMKTFMLASNFRTNNPSDDVEEEIFDGFPNCGEGWTRYRCLVSCGMNFCKPLTVPIKSFTTSYCNFLKVHIESVSFQHRKSFFGLRNVGDWESHVMSNPVWLRCRPSRVEKKVVLMGTNKVFAFWSFIDISVSTDDHQRNLEPSNQ